MAKTFRQMRRGELADPAARAEVGRYKAEIELALQLAELRGRTGKTQSEVARELGVTQSRVSRLEHAEDIQLSTLVGYVRALGGELELTAVFEDESVNL